MDRPNRDHEQRPRLGCFPQRKVVFDIRLERLWRASGIQFSVLFIVAYVISGSQAKVDASADQLVAFYDGHRMRILMAGMLLGFAVLGLLWFGAALLSVLRDEGKGGWGAAATSSSAALGVV